MFVFFLDFLKLLLGILKHFVCPRNSLDRIMTGNCALQNKIKKFWFSEIY
jgi:hypothetical protein